MHSCVRQLIMYKLFEFFQQFEGRKYCEHDFQMLFAPCCHQCGKYSEKTRSCVFFPYSHPFRVVWGWSLCLVPFEQYISVFAHEQSYINFILLLGEFIIGRVIKAMNNSWHPDCFCCDICQAVLADVGFVKNAGRSVPLQQVSIAAWWRVGYSISWYLRKAVKWSLEEQLWGHWF